MTSLSRRRLLQIGSFVLAGGLLFLALYGVDFAAIGEAFRQADYRWLPPLVLLVLGSNLMRAWRWQVLIEALPATATPESNTERSSGRMLEISFSSVMIGYMVNYAAPRMGEVARTANMAARTRHRFSSLFGTVVSERIFDTAVLGLALLSAVGLLFDQLGVLEQQFFDPAWAQLQDTPTTWMVGGTLILLLGSFLLAFLLHRSFHQKNSPLARFWRETLRPAFVSFRNGLLTLLRSPRRGTILVSTLLMWGGYLLMAYIPFRMLHLAEPYGIGIVDAWALMAIGALGILVPSPGGLGSYHYITIQALVHLYGMPEAPAATYAVLTHAAQLVFYTLTGGVAVLYQGSGLRPLLAFRQNPSSNTVPDPKHSEPRP